MDKHEEILKDFESVCKSIEQQNLFLKDREWYALDEVKKMLSSPSLREQPLREALEKIVNDQPLGGFDNSYHRLKNIARTALAGEGGGWIRVEDCLPEEPGIYDVKKVYSKGQEKGQYDGICFTNYDGYRVTHWRPTPPQTK